MISGPVRRQATVTANKVNPTLDGKMYGCVGRRLSLKRVVREYRHKTIYAAVVWLSVARGVESQTEWYGQVAAAGYCVGLEYFLLLRRRRTKVRSHVGITNNHGHGHALLILVLTRTLSGTVMAPAAPR